MSTCYTPAVQIPKHRQADPWPTPSYDRIMAYARARFIYSLRPARPFPAANFCPMSAKPQHKPHSVRIITEQMPAMTPAQWEAWCMKDRQVANPRQPRPAPRKRGRFERFLDRLIAIRTGKYKILPDWHVFSRAPQSEVPEPESFDESWLT